MKNEYPLPHILTFKIRSLSSLGIKYLHNYYFYLISLTTATDVENLFTPQSSMNCPSITFAHFSNRILLSYGLSSKVPIIHSYQVGTTLSC